jgi:hypothetical protein
MPGLKIAHMRQQGIDLIVAPLTQEFGHKTSGAQQAIIEEIQIRSRAAGLAGTVVPVWDSGNGRMAFIAPRNWHPFFQSLDLRIVFSNINRELSW